MTLTLQLFGAFRELESSGRLTLELPEHARVADLRLAFAEAAKARHGERFRPGLLAVSVFASDQELLREDCALAGLAQVAVLPPVSGG